ncbi:hypothetical protein BGZ82_002300 [Podila clonocystis]|nr:hypothetical protein BGZ82_002300 [Podila clonocystis]
MASQAAHPLRFFHLILAALGVILIVLNATLINWATPERSVTSDTFSRQSASLVVPNVAMVFMYLFLAVGHPRFSSQFNHTLCRILFSLAIAVALLYRHSEYLDKLVQFYKINEFYARSGYSSQRSLADDYFCVLGDVRGIPEAIVEHALNVCRVRVSSSVLSFFAAFMVVVELFVAARRGDIGEKKKEKEQEAGEEAYQL